MVRRIITLPCLVMAAWTLTLSWLIADDRFTHFLAPKFQILVYAGAALSLLFTIGAALLPPQNSRNQMIRGLILILPILFILSAGDATLGSFAMEKRGISSGQSLASQSEPRMTQAAGTTGNSRIRTGRVRDSSGTGHPGPKAFRR